MAEVDQVTASAQLLSFMHDGGRPLEAHAATHFQERLAAQLEKAMSFYYGVFGSLTLVSGSRSAVRDRMLHPALGATGLSSTLQGGRVCSMSSLAHSPHTELTRLQGLGRPGSQGQVCGPAGCLCGGAAVRALCDVLSLGGVPGADGRGAGCILHQPRELCPQGKWPGMPQLIAGMCSLAV